MSRKTIVREYIRGVHSYFQSREGSSRIKRGKKEKRKEKRGGNDKRGRKRK